MIEKLLPVRALSRPIAACLAIGGLASIWSATGVRRAVSDPDVWWIAAAGREMARTHAVPRTNLFSFTEPDHPWVMHEWLFGPAYAWGLGHLGPAFFSLFATVAGLVALALALASNLRSTKTLAAASLATLLALIPLGDVFHSPRPSFASLWIVALMIVIANRPLTWKTALLAVLTEWVWTQMHGSFPIGLCILACAPMDRRRVATLGVAAFVTLLNPYGWRLHALVLGYGAGTSESMRWLHEHIIEFSPVWKVIGTPWFSAHAALGLLLVIALAVSALARKRHRAPAMLVLLLSLMALVHVRHWALASFSGALLLAPEIDALVKVDPRPVPRRLVSLACLSIPALAAALAVVFSPTRAYESYVAPSLGGGSVTHLVAHLPDGAKVYADQGFASIVIWAGFPRVRVFYDLRNDCYSPELLSDFTLILDHEPEAIGMLRARGTTHAIVRAGDPMFRAWNVLARNGDLALYEAP